MARKPRVEFPGAFYHVLARGNQKQKTFLNETDYERYRSRLKHYREKFVFSLYAYVLMPNHVHLLIKTGETPLSKIMQGLQFSYTQYFNRTHRKVGHLFQGRYKAILCEEESYLLELVRYIHLNPVRAGLVRRPEDYPWSSHPLYLERGKNVWLEKDFVLGLFDSRKGRALPRYRSFIEEGMGKGSEQRFYDTRDQRYLGDDDFIERTEKKTSQENDRRLWDLPMEKIVNTVAAHFKEDPRALILSGRNRRLAFLRSLVGYLAMSLSDHTHVGVARYFRREGQTLSQGIRKIQRKLLEDRQLNHVVNRLSSDLCQGAKRKFKDK